ncbi:MAG: isoleucine--tRNA ligase [Sedimentisphaeraceae bacterium JB056]
MSEKNYKKTLNLPKTSFAMKANLTQREPQQRKAWDKADMYSKIRAARKGNPQYILHDGPPYANGDIHMGHVINKVLKDIVLKYKTMNGFDTPYIPGWDCHGLPIEVKVMAELGDKAREMEKIELRRLCKKYASKYVKLQSKQFAALGIFADYSNPYLTMIPQYEQGILEVFGKLVSQGLVYKQLKPIHWSIGCETALADAELEYKDVTSSSIYVNFPVADESLGKLKDAGLVEDDEQACFMIWTTTPWTLVANLAVAVHPSLEYVALKYEKDGKKFASIVAVDRLEAVIAAGGLEEGSYTVSDARIKGIELERLRYNHPYVEENPTEKDAYFVVTAQYVTTEDGTGLVHTAPGHGAEDYSAGVEYGLDIYSPVVDNGDYDDTVPDFLKGQNVLKVDPVVIDKLESLGLLFSIKEITHSYPHCWRSRMPVIFRATEQWFVSVDNKAKEFDKSLRELALGSTPDVKWIPAWGEKRLRGMLESRPDWCISRQRAWGLPIPAFYNSEGKTLLTAESVAAVAAYVGKKGSDSWFTDSPQELLGEDFVLPEGFSFDDLHKEENIFDVWFESGCSWHSVADNAGWDVPVDLYLEGSDQHRGWFQLSMLPALGALGKPPFKNVLTHGFTVDAKGMKQSKSLGNYVNAQDEINKYGSDILRLWVSSVNYQEDMRCSDELIGRMQEAYRKIRNTVRYLMSNVDDFDAKTMSVDYNDMLQIDRWALLEYNKMVEGVLKAYENFTFHRVFGLVYNFCTVQLSSIYMDVLKDRLYCDAADSLSRRSAQTVMQTMLDGIIRLVAPVLAHTAEEAWAANKNKSEDVESVHLAAMPKVDESLTSADEQAKWDKLMSLRDEVLRVLEGLRQEQEIGSNQEAEVTIAAGDQQLAGYINELGSEQLAALFIVSEVIIADGEGETKVTARKSTNKKCERCWNYLKSVGTIEGSEELCSRCYEVVK